MRTIPAEDVEKKDFIFPYPEVEPGYFVIRCDSNAEAVHHFEGHPLDLNRATRHFVQANPKRKCHKSEDAVLCREKETVLRKFGYRGKPTLGSLPIVRHIIYTDRYLQLSMKQAATSTATGSKEAMESSPRKWRERREPNRNRNRGSENPQEEYRHGPRLAAAPKGE